MRAIRIQQHGGPEAMELVEVEAPSPGEGELLVEVTASGVNFIDTYQRSGLYEVVLPFTPGSDAAGTVVSVGPGVSRFATGDRVAWAQVPGGYAEHITVPEAKAVAIPDAVTTETAAAAMLQGMTAHYLVNSTYEVRTGDTALVHAAAGGVGLLLSQLIKARGGNVIGTVSTAEKERLARDAGADEIVRYDEHEVAQQVHDLTDDRGVDVVYDGVGRTTFDASLASLRPRGVLVLFGGSSGQVPPFDLQRLNAAGSLFVTRPTLAHYIADRAELVWRAADLFNAVLEGLSVRIGQEFPLTEAAAAHAALEGRKTTGKVLLVP